MTMKNPSQSVSQFHRSPPRAHHTTVSGDGSAPLGQHNEKPKKPNTLSNTDWTPHSDPVRKYVFLFLFYVLDMLADLKITVVFRTLIASCCLLHVGCTCWLQMLACLLYRNTCCIVSWLAMQVVGPRGDEEDALGVGYNGYKPFGGRRWFVYLT